MSSDADSDAAATVALFYTLYTESYCLVAAAALFVYDTSVTLDQEVACFWTSKRTGASLLFFANKWITILYFVFLLATFRTFPSDQRLACSLFIRAEYAIGMVQFVPVAAFSALRAFVLSRSKLLGLLVFALSLAPMAANLVHYGYQFSGENFAPFGCLASDDTTPSLDLRFALFILIVSIVTLIARIPLIVADILLIYITWTTLRGWNALENMGQSEKLSLSAVLFRGGVIYFGVLFVLNVIHLALSAVSTVSQEGNAGESVVATFIAPITAIIVSRFLLELQTANHMTLRLDHGDPSRSRNPYDSSTLSFISSLGGFVNPGLSARSDDYGLEVSVRSGEEAVGKDDGEGQVESLHAAA